MAALGLLTLTLMGIVGALPQLIIGIIADCLSGSRAPLSTLTGAARAALRRCLRSMRRSTGTRWGFTA